jgi:hypothetical protein
MRDERDHVSPYCPRASLVKLEVWWLERLYGRVDGREKVVASEGSEECTVFEVVVDEVGRAGDREGYSFAAEIVLDIF